MRWSRLSISACAWLALSGAALAQEQLSIRCMTVEPDEAQRNRIDDDVRRNMRMREALALAAVTAAPSTCTST